MPNHRKREQIAPGIFRYPNGQVGTSHLPQFLREFRKAPVGLPRGNGKHHPVKRSVIPLDLADVPNKFRPSWREQLSAVAKLARIHA